MQLIESSYEKRFFEERHRRFILRAMRHVQELDDHYQRESILKELAKNAKMARDFETDFNIKILPDSS